MTQAQALDILKTGASVFLTGEPGSGKTHTINTYIAYLRAHGVEPAITASTGIAATHLHGQTIHSWSGIGIRTALSPYDLDAIATTEHVVRRIKKTHTLIIDEISMIDATTLDMVDAVCREIHHSDEPFGGMQVVCVGDFFQLPPINKGEAPRFAFQSRAWNELQPLVCYLSEQHRHEDQSLTDLLTAIRKNAVTEDHVSYLHDRVIDASDAYEGDHTLTRLFTHNTDVDMLNDRELARLETPEQHFMMTEQGKGALVASLKKGCLSPERLALKVGAVVMCTKNNQYKGYVNGTIGTVMSFEEGTRYPIIRTIHGDDITIDPVDWDIEEDGKVKARITQIPLRLAWAITVHKSQGMSLDRALMDLRQVFEYGQGYVALSRVRTLTGIHLLGFNERTFMVHPTILEHDESLRLLSAQAESAFIDLARDELTAMHQRFILASGGVVGATPSTVKRGRKKKHA